MKQISGRNGSRRPSVWAISRISFEVQPGEVVGVIGPNGAGKSTLLKILARITRPTTGQADLYERAGSLPATQKARSVAQFFKQRFRASGLGSFQRARQIRVSVRAKECGHGSAFAPKCPAKRPSSLDERVDAGYSLNFRPRS
jgi:ABC-type uncharacterized transport system ATPase subunit